MAGRMTMPRFDDNADYIIMGSTLNTLWRECYQPLIGGGALGADTRRDVAQRLGALLDRAEKIVHR
jgi:hypothetical protein